MNTATVLFFVIIGATALSASIIPTRPLPGLVAPSEGISIDNYPVEIPNGGLVIDNLPIEIPNGGLVIDNLPVEIPDSIIIEEPFDPCVEAPSVEIMPLPIQPEIEQPIVINPQPLPIQPEEEVINPAPLPLPLPDIGLGLTPEILPAPELPIIDTMPIETDDNCDESDATYLPEPDSEHVDYNGGVLVLPEAGVPPQIQVLPIQNRPKPF